MKKLLVVLLALTAIGVTAFAQDVTWTYGLTVKTGAEAILFDSDTATALGGNKLLPYDADDSVASRLRFDAEAALGDFSAHIRVGGDGAGIVSSTTTKTITEIATFGAAVGVDPTKDAGLASTGTFLPAWWVQAYFMDKMIQMQFGNLDHAVTDSVNKGWGGLNVEGAQIVVTPMTGLSVGVAIPAVSAKYTLDEGLAGTKLGLAYTMPNLAIVKFTYSNAGGDKMSDVAGGVEIDAVPNLKAQFEFQDTDLGNKTTVLNTPGVSDANLSVKEGAIELFEFASYALGPLTPSLEMYQALPGDSALDMQLYVKPGIDYVVMEGTAVGASVKYIMNPEFAVAGTPDSALVVDPYVAFTFNAKAALKIDAAFTLPDLSDTSVWAFPININFKYSY